jgi:hypothetical protein
MKMKGRKMNKRPDKVLVDEVGKNSKRQSGAKEVLTQELAKKIALMVEQFPDASIDVTWENVVLQTKLRFGEEFRRNVLSQKKWDGKKLIADAYHDAKEVQRRQARDTAPKYGNEPRSRLRMIVAKLQAEVLALRSQLAQVRAVQYDEIHSLLDTRTPLNRLVTVKAEHEASRTDGPSGEGGGGSVASIATARLAAGKTKKAAGAGRPNGNKRGGP